MIEQSKRGLKTKSQIDDFANTMNKPFKYLFSNIHMLILIVKSTKDNVALIY